MSELNSKCRITCFRHYSWLLKGEEDDAWLPWASVRDLEVMSVDARNNPELAKYGIVPE